MQEPAASATNGPLTYLLGLIAALISQMNANDWLVIFSIVLVLIRIYIEVADFLHRRAERVRGKKRG